MPKVPIDTPIPPEWAYSQAVRAGDFIFLSGQGPWDFGARRLQGGEIAAQTTLTLENVRLVLESAGATLDDIVKTTVYLARLDDFAAFNAAYAAVLPDPKPARTTAGGVELAGNLVEIDVVAYVGPTPETRRR